MWEVSSISALILSLNILFSLFLSHLPCSLSLVFRRLCFSLFLHSFSWGSQILWWEGHLPNTHIGPKLPNEHKNTHAHRHRQFIRQTHTKHKKKKHTQKNEQCENREAITSIKTKNKQRDKQTCEWNDKRIKLYKQCLTGIMFGDEEMTDAAIFYAGNTGQTKI